VCVENKVSSAVTVPTIKTVVDTSQWSEAWITCREEIMKSESTSERKLWS
jgi:hypothetical protein